MDHKRVNKPLAGPIAGTFFCTAVLALWLSAGCERVESESEVDRSPPAEVEGGVEMVSIPGGSFLMGSLDGQGQPDEHPQHSVTLPGFLLDKTEVTWRQYRKFASDSNTKLPRDPIWGVFEDYPISFMLWAEAQAFCEWSGGRLPSEAEWEKAARGTDGRIYPWGDQWDATRCNSISGGLHRPESAGSFPTCISPYGALDMSGSMLEWTSDLYREHYKPEKNGANPVDGETPELRVMRGGGWMSQPTWVSTTYRYKRRPSSRNMDHGFRCAQDLGDQTHD